MIILVVAGFYNNIGTIVYIHTSTGMWLSSFSSSSSSSSNHGADFSLFGNYHHNIIFGKINIRDYLPPSYLREVWDYSSATAKNIQKAVQNFDVEKAFENLSVHRKVDHLNETLLNIFRNYIPSKRIKFDFCQPPWMNGNLKGVFLVISKAFDKVWQKGLLYK